MNLEHRLIRRQPVFLLASWSLWIQHAVLFLSLIPRCKYELAISGTFLLMSLECFPKT